MGLGTYLPKVGRQPVFQCYMFVDSLRRHEGVANAFFHGMFRGS